MFPSFKLQILYSQNHFKHTLAKNIIKNLIKLNIIHSIQRSVWTLK